MAVKYQDYYEILGVDRAVSQDAVQSSYRKLARKYHPDINKDPKAEDKFKQINEAYEVLGDAENRKKYDLLGMNWHMGDDFSPPPGWGQQGPGRSTGDGGFAFDLGGFGKSNVGDSGFSDFFDSIFGGFGRSEREKDNGFSGMFNSRSTAGRTTRGRDHEAELTVSLEDAYRGGKKTISLTTTETGGDGMQRTGTKSYQVNIPQGVTDGRKLRLPGQGGKGSNGSQAGDLLLTVRIAKHGRISIDGKNLEVIVPITPWEAALGSMIRVPLVEGVAEINLPAGIESEKRIRIKGKGLGNTKDGRGDLFARIRIRVPKSLTEEERALFSELAEKSEFRPRDTSQ